MKKVFVIPATCLVLAVGGCASTGQMRKVEATGETNQRVLRETDQRLRNLENSVTALNSQVALLNNRVYEVRTRNGHKTGMTVVPIIPPQPAPTAVESANQPVPSPPAQAAAVPDNGRGGEKMPPVAQGAPAVASAKMIDPAAPPASFPVGTPASNAEKSKEKPAGPSGQVGRPETVAGPSGQLAAAAPATGGLALPPADIPSAPAANPVPAASSGGKGVVESTPSGAASVPVPALPPSGLALPPEHPGLPPVGAPATPAVSATPSANAAPAPAAIQNQPAAPSRPVAGTKGEESAYKAALKLALSGRSAEGISRFREFLQQYPQGRYAANAEYWIGECFYAQGNYKEALTHFQAVNASYPRHHKNADALLKAGMCLSRLGDKPGAAQKYKTLLADFPNSEAARLARSRGLAL
ncbi:MAG: tol-pal system protein YbgF [Desulfovibrio sp.]|uniref:tol-pal system protein YbgF n=1 Tax=Desulfovibrio sp. TaxID=885 RepID=UPI0025901501|nr:tol-pal system protein YbgF [Desulfovibrio sp.]MCD7983106.1 tol-pal system protein YbgF [Desulfovibrio sp.]